MPSRGCLGIINWTTRLDPTKLHHLATDPKGSVNQQILRSDSCSRRWDSQELPAGFPKVRNWDNREVHQEDKDHNRSSTNNRDREDSKLMDQFRPLLLSHLY